MGETFSSKDSLQLVSAQPHQFDHTNTNAVLLIRVVKYRTAIWCIPASSMLYKEYYQVLPEGFSQLDTRLHCCVMATYYS